MLFINIGFGNMIASNRVVTIAGPESSPIKRMIQDAKDEGRVIDVSCGHKTRSVIITDSDHVILSALTPKKISDRLNGLANNDTDDEEDE